VARLQGEIEAGRAAKTRVDQLEATITARATREMGALTQAQQAAVTAIAGNDAAAQLRAIDALAPTWAAPAPGQAPPAPPIPAPGQSAPVNPNPPPPNPNPQPNVQATYADLQRRNPVQAANYLLMHPELAGQPRSP